MLACSLLGSACTPRWLFQHKDQPYDEAHWPALEAAYEQIIQADDKITISIWGHDELGVGSSFSVYSSTLEQGKFIAVDHLGEISLPLVGKVKIVGLTAREADLYLQALFAKYVRNPIVYLRVLSHTVSIMGEVNSPGNYSVDRQRKTLIEVISDAGGLTAFADAGNIKLIRNHGLGEVEEIEIDLTDMETLQKSSLILHNRDIIYIPELRSKRFQQVVSGLIVPITGIFASAALALSLINR